MLLGLATYADRQIWGRLDNVQLRYKKQNSKMLLVKL